MSDLSREEVASRFDDLRELIGQRFDTVDAQFIRLNGSVGDTIKRVESLEKDAVKIKAYWSAGAAAVAILGGWIRSKVGL